MLKIATFILMWTGLIIAPTTCCAQGYSDYSMSLPHGYEFVRCNHLETVVCRSHSIVFSPLDYKSVGPIREYASTKTGLYLRTAGRKPRNLFAGDSYEEVDESQSFFFVVAAANDRVSGPLTELEFRKHRSVSEDLAWKQPRNPLQFLVLAILMFAISAPILIVGILLWLFIRKRGRAKVA